MASKKCDCCGKNNLKMGVLKSFLSNEKLTYCLICGAMHAEPKHLVDSEIKKLEKLGCLVGHDSQFIYYDEESDTYINKIGEVVPFLFKDGTELLKREDVLERLKKQDNADDIFRK